MSLCPVLAPLCVLRARSSLFRPSQCWSERQKMSPLLQVTCLQCFGAGQGSAQELESCAVPPNCPHVSSPCVLCRTAGAGNPLTPQVTPGEATVGLSSHCCLGMSGFALECQSLSLCRGTRPRLL